MAKAMNNVKTHDEKRRIYNPVQKDAATFLETSEETGGERTLIEIEAAPGGGTAPHYHKTYAEHFEVLRGVLEVRVGERTADPVAPRRRLAKPGGKACHGRGFAANPRRFWEATMGSSTPSDSSHRGDRHASQGSSAGLPRTPVNGGRTGA